MTKKEKLQTQSDFLVALNKEASQPVSEKDLLDLTVDLHALFPALLTQDRIWISKIENDERLLKEIDRVCREDLEIPESYMIGCKIRKLISPMLTKLQKSRSSFEKLNSSRPPDLRIRRKEAIAKVALKLENHLKKKV